MKHDVKIKETKSGRSKSVCIDGVWYPSLSQIPMFTYNSLYAYRQKHNLSTEEAVDGLLCYYEELERRKTEGAHFLAAERKRIDTKFSYHGEYFPSFSQAVRVVGRRKGLSLNLSSVNNFIVRRKLEKEAGLDLYINEWLPQQG